MYIYINVYIYIYIYICTCIYGYIYIYIYSIAPRIPPGSAHGDKTVASCFVVCVHRLCVSVSAALSSVSLYLKSIFLYRKYCSRQPVLLDVIWFSFGWRAWGYPEDGPTSTRLSLHALSSALIDSVCVCLCSSELCLPLLQTIISLSKVCISVSEQCSWTSSV